MFIPQEGALRSLCPKGPGGGLGLILLRDRIYRKVMFFVIFYFLDLVDSVKNVMRRLRF